MRRVVSLSGLLDAFVVVLLAVVIAVEMAVLYRVMSHEVHGDVVVADRGSAHASTVSRGGSR